MNMKIVSRAALVAGLALIATTLTGCGASTQGSGSSSASSATLPNPSSSSISTTTVQSGTATDTSYLCDFTTLDSATQLLATTLHDQGFTKILTRVPSNGEQCRNIDDYLVVMEADCGEGFIQIDNNADMHAPVQIGIVSIALPGVDSNTLQSEYPSLFLNGSAQDIAGRIPACPASASVVVPPNTSSEDAAAMFTEALENSGFSNIQDGVYYTNSIYKSQQGTPINQPGGVLTAQCGSETWLTVSHRDASSGLDQGLDFGIPSVDPFGIDDDALMAAYNAESAKVIAQYGDTTQAAQKVSSAEFIVQVISDVSCDPSSIGHVTYSGE